MMSDLDGARQCYDHALRHNNWSVPAMQAISCILRSMEQFPAAVEYLKNILKIDSNNGDVWGSLGTFPAPAASVSLCSPLVCRPLLPHDGRPAAGLLCLPAGTLPPAGPKGMYPASPRGLPWLLTYNRSPSSGMVSAFCTIATARSSTPKRRFRR